MSKLAITSKLCKQFPGGWSVKSDAMNVALWHTRYNRTLNILEFGAGAGTQVLVDILTRLNAAFNYVSYENKPEYVCTSPKVQTVMWDVCPTELVPGIFDFVIIDGPAGVTRTQWYPLLKTHVQQGTIILIDDFRHFKEFEIALNSAFHYRTLASRTDKKVAGITQITWLVVKVTGVK